MEVLPKTEKTFIIVSQDGSGLGFAKLCIDAGYKTIFASKIEEEDEKPEEFKLFGQGIVPKIDLDKIFNQRDKYKSAYWIWDGNHNFEYGETLRKEGFKVFGGQELTYKMEKDRNFGVEIVKKAGLETPPTFEFHTIEEGLKYLDENLDKAFVFKPDDGEGAFTTYVPDSVKKEAANRELYSYMASQEGDVGTYILQERMDGVEANFELWIYKGKPFFAYCNFESKRKLNHDEGEMVGCSQDIGFTVPLACKGIELTVEKLLPQFRNYTGFLDMNVIVADKSLYFIEFCARFGYNAHPNLFMNLGLRPFPDIMADFIDGNVKDFEKNFKHGFGASITLYIDHPKTGYPIYVTEEMEDKFYHFDTMREENDEEHEYSLSGYGNEVGIVCAHNYTIQDAAKQCLKNVEKITYPMHACRTDLDLADYESSPQKRYEALDNMQFLKV